jgi:predicted  nucleic acid-binding Zn-ribbon protein
MATKSKTKQESREMTIEERLKLLYALQTTDSEIDKIRTLRGELPLEVQDLEDEIAGLNTRIQNYENEISELEEDISRKKNEIKDAEALIKKYKAQQMNVRNNREFDSLSKEIEYQSLEIELYTKQIEGFTKQIKEKEETINKSKEQLEERKKDLATKKEELDAIIADTQKEEDVLEERSKELQSLIDSRLLTAYKRIRANARNGLAIVTIQRDACGGCFNKIPPQRQLDIKTRKKIIVCEYCGRILVDDDLAKEVEEEKKK